MTRACTGQLKHILSANHFVPTMCSNHQCLTFWHWSGVTPYTSSYEFAGSCVFGKQSPGILSLRPTPLSSFKENLLVFVYKVPACHARSVLISAHVHMHQTSLEIFQRISLSTRPSFVWSMPAAHCYVQPDVALDRLWNQYTFPLSRCAEEDTRNTCMHHSITRSQKVVSEGLIPKLRPIFCRVPWGTITRSSWSSRPSHLCRFAVRTLYS